jgi:hypothetical protein
MRTDRAPRPFAPARARRGLALVALVGALLLQAGCTAIAVTGVVVGATVGAGAAVVGTAVGAGVGASKAVVGAMTDDDSTTTAERAPADSAPRGPADSPAY